MRRLRAAALLAAVLAGAAGCATRHAKYAKVHARDGVVVVETGGAASGAGRFLTYRAASGKTADFLVYRDGTGRVHAVLDACKTCYRWKKGYRLEGGAVVCIHCGMRFALDDLAGGLGSCVPIPLEAIAEPGRILIPEGELEAGLRYF